MSSSALFLDVNVPMYAAGTAHPYREACAWTLTEIAANRLSVAIDTEIIQEILYRYGALARWDLAVTMTTNLIDLVPTVLPVTLSEMERAIQLFEEYAPAGVKARDVVHAAVMQANDLTRIISTDTHFDEIADITRLDPQELFEQA